IFSDSISVLQRLNFSNISIKANSIILEIKHKYYQFMKTKSSINSINFSWIPSHIGIRGNETADHFAKTASETPDLLQVPFTDFDELLTFNFFELLKKHMESQTKNQLKEFAKKNTATKVETHSCRHAMKPSNKEKNQNQKCIPYDYNRVVLDTIEGEPDSDYVNASYVDSILKPNAYIVTQGPMENTVTEFWRMVWQEKACCIVMLTKTFDFIRVMCVQYWPASKEKDEEYGGIGVSVLKEEELANFHIRTIRLYKKNENDEVTEERTLLQFHYTEWHSHTCPFGNAVLEFRRRVRAVVGSTIKNESGPMVVHCNDGGGRSGVYLAIDANMELAEEEDAFDVFGYLKKLRQSRRGLIENLEQYKFVYDTLEEFVVCGTSWFPVSELSQRLKQKSVKDPITKMNEYQREYQQICKQTPRFTIGDCAGGHRADNREKNRDVLVVPPDNFRPYLTSFQGNSYTDYINAVFVDGYTKPREYIVTEWPLRHTCGEFWSLVYDYECAAVVVLCVPPPGSTNFPSFWPEGKHSKKYGPVFTIDHISHNHYTNIKTWIFRINKKIVSLTELMAGVKAPPKTVQLFQLTCWPMGHKVPTSTNSLVELMNMVERWRQRTDYGPVAVVSPDGRSRCGVYCAANACIEQVIQHGEVDIFQAVKTVRRHRPQLVENMVSARKQRKLLVILSLVLLSDFNDDVFSSSCCLQLVR
ncbi:Receptor-type tyrosine-protein phosphatase T, partial [Habropoda laboriosa]